MLFRSDMDVTYSDYTNLSQEEQAAAQEGFQSKLGISYEDFTARLPQGFGVASFASLNARTSPEGDYVPHDYILTLSIYETGGHIAGFAGMTGHHLSGLFVRSTCRSTGIGRALLTHLKARHPLITLQVYQNNQRALAFYQREGFSPLDQDTEPETGQVYLTLVWRKP